MPDIVLSVRGWIFTEAFEIMTDVGGGKPLGGNGIYPKCPDALIIDDIEGTTGLDDSGWLGCVAVDRNSSGLTGVDCVAAGGEQARKPKEFVDSQNFSILHDSRGLEPIPGIADAVFKSEKSPHP